MLNKFVTEKVVNDLNNHPLVFEGANGSLGLSFLKVLKELDISPKVLLLTTHSSDLENEWISCNFNIEFIKSSHENFFSRRKKLINSFGKGVNVFFASGYGRPNMFLDDPIGVIDANIKSLISYSDFNINKFAYFSTSELYSGLNGEVSEDVTLPTSPQHPRGIYIESKRLGEAIVSNLISKNATRVASYRIALATPPRLLNNDHRVLADLITSAKENNKVILNGGQKLLRQYQYGPNAIYKILGSISNGTSNLYNNAGSHILTLGELAKLIGKVFNVDVEIKENIQDSSSPKVVNINSERINSESGYLLDKEEDFFSYLNRIVNA